VLPDVLDEIPLGLGDAHRGIFFVNDTETPPLFMTPATKNVAFFSIMHAGVSPPLVQEALEAFSRARDKLQSAGGRTYLADWLGEMSPNRWAAHFGPKIDGWQSDKSLFDPAHVFCSQVIA
jgi:hypothetical protein